MPYSINMMTTGKTIRGYTVLYGSRTLDKTLYATEAEAQNARTSRFAEWVTHSGSMSRATVCAVMADSSIAAFGRGGELEPLDHLAYPDAIETYTGPVF